MKDTWKGLLILAIIGVVLMSAGFVLGAETSLYLDLRGIHIGNEERHTQSQPTLEKITDIEINAASANIEIIPSNEFGLEIKSRPSSPITYTLDGGKLKISQNMKNLKLINMDFDLTSDSVTVFVPNNEKLESINIRTLSGNVELADVSAKRFAFDMASGNLDAIGLLSDGLTLRLISGNAELDGQFAGRNALNVVSGSVEMCINGSEADYNRSVSVVSGEIYVNDEKNNSSVRNSAENDLDISMTSGTVSIDFTE